MKAETTQSAHKARAMQLANGGIESQAAADYEAARHAWTSALVYVEQNLPGDEIVYWIRSGLGDALLKGGDYHGALEMAETALAWCALKRAPLASLTMAMSCLRLGDMEGARSYARQACELRGDEVLNVFSPADRQALCLVEPDSKD